eukprot:144053-Chlamydomonas_euryale.AAC.1
MANLKKASRSPGLDQSRMALNRQAAQAVSTARSVRNSNPKLSTLIVAVSSVRLSNGFGPSPWPCEHSVRALARARASGADACLPCNRA